MGDVAVTLVDLIQRGLLAVEETADGGDWLLTPLGGTAPRQKHGALLDYEKRLLDGLSEGGGESRLSSLADRFEKVLDETRKVLIREAAHQGWLRNLRHDQRTGPGWARWDGYLAAESAVPDVAVAITHGSAALRRPGRELRRARSATSLHCPRSRAWPSSLRRGEVSAKEL
jgi:hypothetical protein